MAKTTLVEQRQHLNFSFDLRLITFLLAVTIVAMLLIWKPWSPTDSTRTIDVTGEARLTAEPDEFVFYPTYDFKNADKAAALAEVSKKSDEVVAKLKELGVADKDIKTNSSGYDFPYYSDTSSPVLTYTLQLTVTIGNRELAQKVQDYLVTTTPTGAISPQATFSDTKRRELESKARDEATKEARAKAEQSAENLGFKIGKVKSVQDGLGFGNDILPLNARGIAEDTATTKLGIQPGENEFTYSVSVTYYLR